MLLVAQASSSTALPTLAPWLFFPLLALCLLGMVGLFYSIRGLVRLTSPTENAFTLAAAETVFRFALTRPGLYDIGCTRASRWGLRFTLPPVTLGVRPLPSGVEQRITASRWGYVKQSNMSGDTTLRIGSFRAAAPGEYELRNPGAAQFQPGDKLRIMPTVGVKMVFYILAIIAAAFALLGGGIMGLFAGLGFLS